MSDKDKKIIALIIAGAVFTSGAIGISQGSKNKKYTDSSNIITEEYDIYDQEYIAEKRKQEALKNKTTTTEEKKEVTTKKNENPNYIDDLDDMIIKDENISRDKLKFSHYCILKIKVGDKDNIIMTGITDFDKLPFNQKDIYYKNVFARELKVYHVVYDENDESIDVAYGPVIEEYIPVLDALEYYGYEEKEEYSYSELFNLLCDVRRHYKEEKKLSKESVTFKKEYSYN